MQSKSLPRRRSPNRRYRQIRRVQPYRSAQVITVVKEAITWIVAAMILRLVIDVIMAISSQFWLLGVMVACLPAVTAIWMTHLSPQRGFILGYRCLLVMAGLLLGGKLEGFS